MPWMSVSTRSWSPSMTRPMAMPATGALIGTPQSISASVLRTDGGLAGGAVGGKHFGNDANRVGEGFLIAGARA